jgi:hypothetical protein
MLTPRGIPGKRFFLLSIFALAMASPSVWRGECRGGGSGPLHGFILLRRLVTHVSTIFPVMEPSFIFAHTLGVSAEGVTNSSSAWRRWSTVNPAARSSLTRVGVERSSASDATDESSSPSEAQNLDLHFSSTPGMRGVAVGRFPHRPRLKCQIHVPAIPSPRATGFGLVPHPPETNDLLPPEC